MAPQFTMPLRYTAPRVQSPTGHKQQRDKSKGTHVWILAHNHEANNPSGMTSKVLPQQYNVRWHYGQGATTRQQDSSSAHGIPPWVRTASIPKGTCASRWNLNETSIRTIKPREVCGQ